MMGEVEHIFDNGLCFFHSFFFVLRVVVQCSSLYFGEAMEESQPFTLALLHEEQQLKPHLNGLVVTILITKILEYFVDSLTYHCPCEQR